METSARALASEAVVKFPLLRCAAPVSQNHDYEDADGIAGRTSPIAIESPTSRAAPSRRRAVRVWTL